jgi:tyrosyl-tRNA synthetase
MGGDIQKIRTVGEYMVEVWKACGMDMKNVKFVWTSDEINTHSNEYWLRVMDIARRFNLSRVKRCSQIMGRNASDDLAASQILYPCMQCADIFHLKADICQLGLDQRKVNMLAREYCDEVKIKLKPIILSHRILSLYDEMLIIKDMLMGLKEGQAKMSKSDPDSAIFMEDTEADVNLKIKKAFCPPLIIKDNPCFDYLKHIVFQKIDSFTVARKEVDGGEKYVLFPLFTHFFRTYTSYEEIVADYTEGKLHPSDLKPALAKAINQLIQPVRDHFTNDAHAKQLLQKVKSYKVTK